MSQAFDVSPTTPHGSVLDLDYTAWVSEPTRGDPALVRTALVGSVAPEDLAVLAELDEGIWWSTGTRRDRDAPTTGVPAPQPRTPGSKGLDEVVALIRRAARSTHAAGTYPLLVAHLRAVCLRAWELTWDHSALLAVLTAGTDGLVGDQATTPAPGSADWLALQLVELTRIDLRLETACSTTSFTAVAAQCDEGVRTGDAVAEQVRERPPTGFSVFVAEAASRRRSYYAAVGRAATAALAFLTETGDDLDGAIEQLHGAESDQGEDEFCRAELRAHRVSLEAMAGARTRSWLWVDAGKITIIYPFGLRGAPFSTVVTTVRDHAAGWSLGGVALGNQPTQLLLVDDVWRGDDPLQRRYEGTQLDLPPVHIAYSEAAAAAAEAKGAMSAFTLEPSLVLSQLGNHHLRFEIEITDAGPHTLAYAAWLGAPEFGDLSELGSGIGLEGAEGEHVRGRLADLVDDVLHDLTARLRTTGLDDVQLSARRGMSHVITTVYRASALPAGRRRDAEPLTHAAHLADLFGSQVLFHPVPSGVAALASWTLYQHQGEWIPTPALVEEQLVMSGNHTVLASFHAPLFMVETVAEAVEFVVSLDGLFSGWQDDLADFYRQLRDDVESFTQHLTDPDAVGAAGTDDAAAITEHLKVVDRLEREQVRLRQFTTRARVSLLFVTSPALVASPVMRQTIDDLLATRPSWRGRHEFTETAEQVLGDRLNQLIGSLTRRREAEAEVRRLTERALIDQREEAAREQQGRERQAAVEREAREANRRNALAQTMVTVIAAVGVSGVVAILQAGLELKGPLTVLLAAGVVVIALVCGLVFWLLTHRGGSQP